eukprot:s200_g28.t3
MHISVVPCHAVLWQAHLVNDLLRAYAPFAYGPDGKRDECSEDQLPHCADAVASLVSLDGLGEFLVDALEHGVASPKPERLSRLGWSSAANALLSTKVTGGGAVELGGGSGAGFQVICEDRGIATLGGGGGGGAFGWIEDHLAGYLGARPVGKNETVGGGAGGGMQLFFPANVTGRPWEADHWISWGSGGGHGCGSCKAGDTFCEDSPLRITCGAKMDDNGAVDRAAGLQALRNWRVGVLRACYDAGKLAVIGGGGGGAGGARCCAAVPRLLALTKCNDAVEMFVLSSQQLHQLLQGCPRGTLLDIGAGAGDVTCQLAQLFDQVLVTEVSRPMVAMLQEKGFPVLSAPDLSGLEALAEKHEISLGPGASVDCIANVLDRCDRPLTLLKDVREHLKPGGRLLLAVVLPFRPFVESGIFKLQPSEQLQLNRTATWEAAVEEMWQNVLMPMGFNLEAHGRLKYGFGFRAELRPAPASETMRFRSGLPKGAECCPDLSGWNSTTMAVGLGSQLAQGFARRLSVAFGGLGGGALSDELAPLVDPFARENTGHQPPGHANRRPLLEELMKQHDKRLGAFWCPHVAMGCQVLCFPGSIASLANAGLPTRSTPLTVCCAQSEFAEIQEWFNSRHKPWNATVVTDSEELLDTLRDSMEVPKALDVGCGSGREAILLASRGWEVFALDRDARGLERLAALAQRQAQRDQIPLAKTKCPADLRGDAGRRWPSHVLLCGAETVTIFGDSNGDQLPMAADVNHGGVQEGANLWSAPSLVRRYNAEERNAANAAILPVGDKQGRSCLLCATLLGDLGVAQPRPSWMPHEDALAMKQEVLEVQRQVLGPRHPDTLTAQNNVSGGLGGAETGCGAQTSRERQKEEAKPAAQMRAQNTLASAARNERVDRSELIARAANTETCALPTWLNMTQLTALNSRPGDVSPDGSGTKEPEVALKYIFKFNPLQGYLADGASRCGGWSDWCCVCHAAQWQIACLPEVDKNAVDWFLTEDCCESKMRKDTSSPGYVADATPLRDSVVMWRPNVGWIELPRSMNVSDSYHWMGEYGDDGLCPTVAFPEMWIRAKAADADANVPLMLGNVEHSDSARWTNTRMVATSAAVLGYMAQAALVIILLFMARLVKGGPRREQERYIQMTEV